MAPKSCARLVASRTRALRRAFEGGAAAYENVLG